MSMAGEAAAEARRRAVATPGNYNLQLGPTAWTLAGGLGVEFNDNVDYREVDPDADMIFRPQVNTRMHWPITQKNALDFNVDAGYAAYVSRTDLSRVFIAPGSELSFDAYVGDFVLNFHDRFSITEDAYQNPAVTTQGAYSRLENVVGMEANWDLNRMLVALEYDHADYVALTEDWRYADGRTEVLFGRVGLALNNFSLVGVEGGAGWMDYNDPAIVDGVQSGGGGFYRAQISQHLNASARLGYTVYSPEAGGTIGVASDEGSLYGQVGLNHRVSKTISYGLQGGRIIQTGLQLGLMGQNLDYYFLRARASWHFIRHWPFDTGFLFEDGTETGAAVEEDFQRWGADLAVAHNITSKLTARLAYRFLFRESDLPNRGYTVNSISLNCTYRF